LAEKILADILFYNLLAQVSSLKYSRVVSPCRFGIHSSQNSYSQHRLLHTRLLIRWHSWWLWP